MSHLSPVWIVLGGIGCLLVLLHERARIVAALAVFFFAMLAAAHLLGLDLRFWK
jgi:hypothetical protein